MTFREKLLQEHPDKIAPRYVGGCKGCPRHYDYEDKTPSECNMWYGEERCNECWDRQMPGTDADEPKSHILDSGNRREFETGAVRDIQDGKGRCDLMPLDVIASMFNRAFGSSDNTAAIFGKLYEFTKTGECVYLLDILDIDEPYDSYSNMLLEVAKHFEEGCKKYGENNWQKGIPVHCYIDSAIRHYLKWLRGDNDEPHDRAFCWNILCCIWTCQHHPELNEYAQENA